MWYEEIHVDDPDQYGIASAVLAGIFPIRAVADLTNIGILSAFVVVCTAVILFRYTRPDAPRTFRLPWMPIVPAFGVLASAALCLLGGAALARHRSAHDAVQMRPGAVRARRGFSFPDIQASNRFMSRFPAVRA
mgnify:CR=1 FL=1